MHLSSLIPVRSFVRTGLLATLAAVMLTPAFAAAAEPASASASASATAAKPIYSKESFIDGFFNRKDIKPLLTGAVVAVVNGDQPVLVKGYGYANVERQTPVDPNNTLFRVASITKTFTATTVMQLAEEGKVELDRDISPYLKGIVIPNKTGSPLTLKHLMTHTSGFDRTEAAADEGDPGDVYPLDRFIKDNIPTVVRKPGEAYRYDNYAYNLLGYIVQNVSGKPFDQVVQQRIFMPLGMKNSHLILTPDIQKRLATPYDSDGEPLPQYATYPNNSPDGGMMTTGTDMARFMIAELNGGKLGDASILNAQSLQQMQQLSVSIHPDIPGVGFGFESSYPDLNNGQFVIDKGGAATGFQSHMWLLPDRQTGLFLALNSTRNARTIQRELFKAFMDHYFPTAEGTDTPIAPLRQSKEQLAPLTGIYRDLRMPMWHYDVEARDGGLTVTDAYGEHSLSQVKELLFVDETGRYAAFKENGEGKITYFSYNKADSWSEMLPNPKLYSDVPNGHAYAKAIYYVQQQGMLAKENDGAAFKPEHPITREQFIGQLVVLADIPLSEEPVIFADAAGSPYAAEIQTALEIGLVSGTNGGRFEPDRAVTRQEAAVIIARALQLQFGSIVSAEAAQEIILKAGTSAWAVEGVRIVLARGCYGPDVVKDANGVYDFRSRQPLLRQEAAAMFYRFP
ncbi:serine hydrolase [Paenibacillus radicis (ex Gao et al. 2016)]|uniref:SLH domain-containing protein n=1 Tax=Paenibacillus radicis (ex Gao et al. 2016) TaxID=1737354 RepID=A0A917GR18_9BACL|nr:serine hydrolase [Paenibacillus radicis (ex Gao et al. 2016)]GGG53938.1 hypothetical protein GCM10010918_03420 [Paenibacillus radicis (ex Gao et al. 2016)]